jgi:hypothetical protein
VDDPSYKSVLDRMRNELKSQMLAAGDLGLLPEREMHARAENSTPYEIAKDPNLNPIEKLWDAAWFGNQGNPGHIPKLKELLKQDDPALRWWGALGLVTLGKRAKPAEEILLAALEDASPDVRVAAAEALAHIGHLDKALPVLEAALQHDSPFVRLAVLNVIQRIGPPAKSLIPAIQQAGIKSQEHRHVASYVGRMVGYLPGKLEE